MNKFKKLIKKLKLKNKNTKSLSTLEIKFDNLYRINQSDPNIFSPKNEVINQSFVSSESSNKLTSTDEIDINDYIKDLKLIECDDLINMDKVEFLDAKIEVWL